MLAAGEDDAAVHGVMDATRELAGIQSSGAGGATLAAATKQRRATVEALVTRAVKSLARFDPSAESKRAEIRQLVDQLSRHPEVADAWIDATLRDLPEDAFGFGMFTEGVEAPAQPVPATKKATKKKPVEKAPQPEPATRASQAETRADAKRRADERAERAQQARQARRDLAAARRDLVTFERRVASARESVAEAEARLHAAEEQRDEAQRRHDAAAEDLQRLDDA